MVIIIVPFQVNITGKQELNELDTLILELNCTANAQANFTWEIINNLENTIIVPGTRNTIITINLGENDYVCISQSKLIIFNASESDSGNYVCIAESEYNILPANDSYRVNVTGIVKITSNYIRRALIIHNVLINFI